MYIGALKFSHSYFNLYVARVAPLGFFYTYLRSTPALLDDILKHGQSWENVEKRIIEELSDDLEEFIENIIQDTDTVQDDEDVEELIPGKHFFFIIRIKVFIFINKIFFFKDIRFCNKILSIKQEK